MELELLKLLGAGGDMATIGLLFVMWRFDRRLLSLEVRMAGMRKETRPADN